MRIQKLMVFVICLLLLCSVSAFSEKPETFTSGDYRYQLKADGTAEIVRFIGNNDIQEVVVPAVLDGHSVTTIGDKAFSGSKSLTSITIPDSVMTIGERAFDECDSLTNIIVPRNSYAEQYVKENNLPYTYPDSTDWLNH